MESDAPSEVTTFSLRGRPHAITLESDGLHHPTGTRRGGLIYTAYRDITHLATSSRAIWLGTRRSVYVISRGTFVDPHGPEHLVRALLEQISRQPGGSAQLARMAQIEETARGRVPLRATYGLFAICAALYAAQAAEVALDAIGRSDGSRRSVAQALRSTDMRDTALGRVAFDARGDLRGAHDPSRFRHVRA